MRLSPVSKTPIVSLLFFLLILSIAFAAPTGEKEKKPYEIAVVVKLVGIPWFNTMERGVKDAAKQLGVNAYQTGPPQADEAQQVKVVEDLIAKGVKAICVVPNDAKSLEPAFKKAHEKGIVVITHESPNQKEHDYNLELIDNKKFGEYHLDKLVEKTGPNAEYAIFVGSLTVPAHNIWADSVLAYAKVKYHGMKLVTDRIPCSEDQELSRQKTLELIKAYPNLKGIIGFGSLGPPGAAQAVREKGLIGKVFVVGTVIPSHAAQYLKDGSLTLGTLWNPADAGFAMVYVAKMMLDGQKITTDTNIPRVGKPLKIEGKFITFDAANTFTAENVDKFDF